MATSSANDIIDRALTKARVFHPGESIPAKIATQVFGELNDMLERWALERLMVSSEVLESFNLIVGQADYDYGDGGDFNSARPDDVLDDTFVRVGGTDFPVALKPLDIYRSRQVKDTGARPKIMAINPTFPKLKVLLWPVPTAIDEIHFRVRKQLVSFADRTTAVVLPPGYRGGIVASLAIEISPNFGKKVSNELAFQAAAFYRSIKRANKVSVRAMKSDLAAMTGRGRSPRFSSGPFV